MKKALVQADCKTSTAAKLLKLKNHQTLSDILEKQFPELYDELGFTRRTRTKNNSKTKTFILNKEKIRSENPISRVILPDKNYSFDFEHDLEKFDTYYFDPLLMKDKFDIDSGAVIAVAHIENFSAAIGKQILVTDGDDRFLVGTLEYNSWANVYYLTNTEGEPHSFDQTQIKGEVLGFCPIDETDEKFIRFSKLNNGD